MFFTPVGLNRWPFGFFLVNLLKYKFMKRFIFLSMMVLSIGLFSCKKYPDGGLKNMAAGHIRGTRRRPGCGGGRCRGNRSHHPKA